MLTCGIIGLPNVGKSTIFNTLTQAGAEASNYPFCTIEPNMGVVFVPDKRLGQINSVIESKKTLPAGCKFIDIAGLVKGASQGEGLGNKFLSHIREVSALVHVVRCFDDPDVVMTGESPREDIETVETELALADLATVLKRRDAVRKLAKSGKPDEVARLAFLERVIECLDTGRPVRALEQSEQEVEILRDLHLITAKKQLVVVNVSEELLTGQDQRIDELRSFLAERGDGLLLLSARIESEIAQIDDLEERREFLQDIGLEESGLDRLTRAAYDMLELVSFFTAGPQEVRAWTVSRGSMAREAASVIHTDIARGFIKAEIYAIDDLLACGSEAVLKQKGLLRLEGKEYIVQDGDVIYFRFNV